MKKYYFIPLLLFMVGLYRAQGQGASVTIRSDYMTSTDTLELYVWNDLIGKPFRAPHRMLSATLDSGRHTFRIDSLPYIGWISLCLSYQKVKDSPLQGIFHVLPIMPGDSLSVDLVPQRGTLRPVGMGYDGGQPIFDNNWACQFGNSPGAQRSRLFMELEQMSQADLDLHIAKDKDIAQVLAHDLDRYTEREKEGLQYLTDHRHLLSDSGYTLLRYEFMGRMGYRKIRHILTKMAIGAARDRAREYFYSIRNILVSDAHTMEHFCPELVYRSPAMTRYLSDLSWLYATLEKGHGQLRASADWIDSTFEDKNLRDRVWAQLLLSKYHAHPDSALWDEISKRMRDGYSLARIKPLHILGTGDTPLDFELPDADGQMHRASDYRGKVVLIDFWYMGCTPCRAYIRDVLTPLTGRLAGDSGFVLLTVSTDERVAFAEAVDSEILPKGAVALYTDDLRFRHPLIDKLGIYSFPYPILLDTNGVLRKAGKDLKNLESLLDEIGKLQKPEIDYSHR